MPNPFSRLISRDPDTNRIIQDLYDKLAAVQASLESLSKSSGTGNGGGNGGGNGSGNGGTGTGTCACSLKGDVIGPAGSNTVVKLQGRGVDPSAPALNNVLEWNGSVWIPGVPPSGFTDPTTTKGDLIARGLSAPATRLGVGTDGQVLTADSAQPLGVRWGTGGSSQTPWTQNIDGATFNLSNAGVVQAASVIAGGTTVPNLTMQPSGMLMNSGPAGGGRWRIRSAGAESSGNAGSDLQFQRFSDAGGGLGTALTIVRSTGFAGFGMIPAYAVDVAGDVNISGVYRVNGVPIGTGNVTSVFTRTGAVVAVTGDYTAAQVTNAVSTIGSYADPAWITSLAWAKITGAPSVSSYQTPWLSNIDGGGFSLANVNSITVNGTAGSRPAIAIDVGAALRWVFTVVNAESSGNNGSDLAIYRYSDTQVLLGIAFEIVRSSGLVYCNGNMQVGSNVGIGTAPSGYMLDVLGSSPMRLRNTATGPVLLASIADGSSNNLSWYKDPTPTFGASVGISSPSSGLTNGNIILATFNGTVWTDRVTVTNAGLVGIGRTPTTYPLEVQGDCNLTSGVYRINGVPISTTPAGSTGQIQFNNAGAFGASGNLFWDITNQELGIGVTPTTTLDVQGGANPIRCRGGQVGISNNNQIRWWGLKSAADLWALGTDINAGNGSSDFHFWSFSPAGVKMTITAAGLVGIGTTSPQVKLQIEGQSNGSRLDLIRLENYGTGSGTGAGIGFGVTAGNTFSPGWIAGPYLTSGAGGVGLQFGTGPSGADGAVRMTITDSGNVGIGITTPSAKLYVLTSVGSFQDAIGVGTQFECSITGASGSALIPNINEVYVTNCPSISGFVYGHFYVTYVQGTTAVPSIYGVVCRPYVQGTGTVGTLCAFVADPYFWGASASGAVTNYSGFFADSGAYGGGATSVITNWRQFYAQNIVAGAKITNLFGLVIDPMSAGTVENIAIFTNQSTSPPLSYAMYHSGNAPSYFGGRIGVGVTGPAYPIEVQGDINIVSGVYRVGGVPIVSGVSSVFTRTGAVVALAGDYSAFYVPIARQVIAGTGMTGGGALSADVTLNAKPMVASGASHSAGMVPDPGATAGTTKFLREDATWAVPAGTGASQTPWLSDINAANFNLNSVQSIGIGAAAQGANQPLLINSSHTSYSIIVDNQLAAGSAVIEFINDGSRQAFVGIAGTASAIFPPGVTFLAAGQDLAFLTNGITERMRINAAGNVGIGVTNSTRPLTINATATTVSFTNISLLINRNSPSTSFASIGFSGAIAYWPFIYAPINTDDLAFGFDNGTVFERMRITAAGLVGIGSTAPPNKLSIQGDAANSASITATTISINDTDAAAGGTNGGRLLRIMNRRNTGVISQNLSTTDQVNFNLDNIANTGLWVTLNNGAFSVAFATAGTNPRTLSTATLTVIPIGVGIGRNPTTYPLEVQGDCNITGVYRVNGVPISTGGSGSPAGSTGYVQYNNAGAFGASANLFWDITNSRLGIGTTSPVCLLSLGPALTAHKLALYDNGATYYGLGMDGAAIRYEAGTSGGHTFYTNAAATTAMTILSSGFVGIGTTNPSALLHVVGGGTFLQPTAQFPLRLQAGNSGIPFSSVIQFYKQDATQLWQIGSSGITGTVQEFSIYDVLAGASRIYINASGNVGLGGANNPGNLLTLPGGSATPSLRFVAASNAAFYWDIGRENATTGDFVFGGQPAGAASEKMRITIGGFVGIGTSTPGTLLEVYGSPDANKGMLRINASGNNPALTLYGNSANAAARQWQIATNYQAYGNLDIMRSASNSTDPTTATMSITNAGKVGIGTAAPVAQLHIVPPTSTTGISIAAPAQSALWFQASNQGGGFIIGRSISSDDLNTFFIYDAPNNATRLLITPAGLIGLSRNPSYALDVQGDCNVTGAFRVNGVAIGSGGITSQSVVTGSRAFNTVYGPTGAKPVFIAISIAATLGQGGNALSDASTNPTTTVASAANGGSTAVNVLLTFWAIPGNYFKVTGSGTINSWVEWS